MNDVVLTEVAYVSLGPTRAVLVSGGEGMLNVRRPIYTLPHVDPADPKDRADSTSSESAAIPEAKAAPAVGQDAATKAPEPPAGTSPTAVALARRDDILPAAVSQLQDVKGDTAVLLQAIAALVAQSAETWRLDAKEKSDEASDLRERVHRAELVAARLETDSIEQVFRGIMLALGGVLAGFGYQQPPNVALIIVGIAVMLASAFVRRYR